MAKLRYPSPIKGAGLLAAAFPLDGKDTETCGLAR